MSSGDVEVKESLQCYTATDPESKEVAVLSKLYNSLSQELFKFNNFWSSEKFNVTEISNNQNFQVMFTRMDNILSVTRPDGTRIVDHIDGTRITTVTNPNGQ